MKNVLNEIHRRSLWQVLGIYLAGSWVALQVVETLIQSAGLPDWVQPLALVLLVIGFPIVLATAFLQEGLKPRSSETEATARSGTADTGPRAEVAASRPAGAHGLFTWKRALVGGAAAFGLLTVGVGGWMAMRALGIGPAGTLVAKGLLDERATIILADFEASDSTLARAATEAFRVDLSQSHFVRLAEPAFLRDALRRMQGMERTLTVETGREIAVREGLPAVIGGQINPAGTGFVLTANVVSAESGEVLVSQRETARDASEVIDALDELSKNLRERIGESLRTIRAEPPLERVTTANLEALRKYSQANYAIEVTGEEERGIALLEEALALDPEFAMAWRKLGVAYGNRDESRAREVEALTKAFEYRERLPERERYLAMAAYYSGVLEDDSRTITAYENLLALDPADDWALNNLGIEYNENRDFERAAELFERALATDSTLLPPYFNLVVSRVDQGDLDAARSVVDRARANLPGNPQVEQLATFVAANAGDRVRAREILEGLRTAQSQSPFWMTWTDDVRAALAGTEGKLAESSRLRAAVERRHVARDLPSEALDVALGPAWNAIFVAGNRTGGLEAVDEALSRYPLSEIDPLNRPYLQLVILYGNASRLDRARELAAEWRAEVPEELRTDVAERAMQAQLALAEGRYEEAIRGFRANDEGLCLVCAVTGLALAYDRAGQADSAIASYERYVATTWPGKMYFDEQWLGRSYERLATLYDERGDLDNAARYYAMLAELWAEADPVLQPRVRAAQARLEEIVRARG